MRAIVLLFACLLAGCGASSSDATGPSLNCRVTLHEEDNTSSTQSSASVGDTTQNCGPQNSPNRPKTITITDNVPGE